MPRAEAHGNPIKALILLRIQTPLCSITKNWNPKHSHLLNPLKFKFPNPNINMSSIYFKFFKLNLSILDLTNNFNFVYSIQLELSKN